MGLGLTPVLLLKQSLAQWFLEMAIVWGCMVGKCTLRESRDPIVMTAL